MNDNHGKRPTPAALRTIGAAIAMACVLVACRSEPQAAVPAVKGPTKATAGVARSAAAALPRSVADVSLGMSREDAERRLGVLKCRERGGDLRVCNTDAEQIESAKHLEVYVHHGRVISLAYDIDTPENAWTFLDTQVSRFGNPSLSSQRSRDQSGHDHEVFGWKDDASLYSVRFIWGVDEQGSRRLLGTNIALWDREAYEKWEVEAEQQAQRQRQDEG